MNHAALTDDLRSLLGDDAFIALAEAFGGTRLYVPYSVSPQHEIVEAIGEERARRLINRYAPATLRVPLARETRALHYRAVGMSNAQIARRLGINETSVDKLFRRRPDAPAKGSAQLSLFD